MQSLFPVPPLDTKQAPQQSLLRTPRAVHPLGHCIRFPGIRQLRAQPSMAGYIWPMHEYGEEYQAYQTVTYALILL